MAFPSTHEAYLQVKGFPHIGPVALHPHNADVEFFHTAIDLMQGQPLHKPLIPKLGPIAALASANHIHW